MIMKSKNWEKRKKRGDCTIVSSVDVFPLYPDEHRCVCDKVSIGEHCPQSSGHGSFGSDCTLQEFADGKLQYIADIMGIEIFNEVLEYVNECLEEEEEL